MFLPDVTNWEEEDFWRFLDVENWEAPVRELCRREGITFETMKISGYSSVAVYTLDQKYVIKISPPWLAETAPIEEKMLRVLEGISIIPAPRLLATGVFEDRINWPYLIMEFIPGEYIEEVRHRIERDNFLAIARRLGEITRAFHDINLDSVSFLPNWHRNLAQLAKGRRDTIEALHMDTRLPQNLRKAFLDFLASNNVEEWLDTSPVVVHGEIGHEHVLFVEQNGRWEISGLVDHAGVGIGLRVLDWNVVHEPYDRMFAYDHEAMDTLMRGYDPHYTYEDFRRESFALFLCNGAGMVDELCNWLARSGFSEISSVQQFQRWYWSPVFM